MSHVVEDSSRHPFGWPRWVDPVGQLDFLERMYLGKEGFIAQGGSKLKLVQGTRGAGKSRFLQELARRARALDYLVVTLDASTTEIKRIDDLYRELMKDLDVWNVVRRFCMRVVAQLGTDPARIPAGMTYMDWEAQQGRVVEVVRRDVKDELASRLFRNPNLHRTFATGLTIMAGDVLGVRPADPEAKVTLQSWIKGLPVPARDRNRLNLRQGIDRYNARLMLRSWLAFVRMAGYRGLCVGIDNLDVLLNTNPAQGPRYTRVRREDFYETVRELIDDMDNLEGLFLVMGAQAELFKDTRAGLRSYPALWMRLQNEVDTKPESRQVNLFADIIDLDRLWKAGAPRAFTDLALAAWCDNSETTESRLPDDLQETIDRILQSVDMSVSRVKRIVQAVAEYRGRNQG